MSRSSALGSVTEEPDVLAGFRAARARVAMLKTSSVLSLQQFGKAWELLQCDADRAIVAEQELLARVRSPANFGDPGRENARQTLVEQAVGDRGNAQARAHARQERREQ